MRVLMTSWAWPTHYYPMVPLGWALRTAGHDVHVASQPALTHTITQSGHTAVPIGEDVDFSDLMAEFFARSRKRESSGQRPFEFRDLRSKGAMMLKMFVTLAEAMVDGLVDYARAWRPDVIIYEPTTYAAPITATALNIPTVRHLWGIDYTHQTHHYEPQALANLYQQLHLDNVNTLGDLTIDPCPPTAQTPANYPRQLIRYIPYNGPGTHPTWLHTPPTQPRICLTWGTSSTRLGNQRFLAPEVLGAIDAADVEIVVAVSEQARSLLPSDRPNVRVVEQLPLHLLLPSCDLIVHQGGMGTTMTAITHGTPQIVIPQLPDTVYNAKLLANAGAAAVLTREQLTEPHALQRLVDRLLGDPDQREKAKQLQATMNAQPTLAEAVRRIEQLVASHHTKEAACAS